MHQVNLLLLTCAVLVKMLFYVDSRQLKTIFSMILPSYGKILFQFEPAQHLEMAGSDKFGFGFFNLLLHLFFI